MGEKTQAVTYQGFLSKMKVSKYARYKWCFKVGTYVSLWKSEKLQRIIFFYYDLSPSPCFEMKGTQNKQYQIHFSLFYVVYYFSKT